MNTPVKYDETAFVVLDDESIPHVNGGAVSHYPDLIGTDFRQFFIRLPIVGLIPLPVRGRIGITLPVEPRT
ncbi:MAG: hypothetical protein ACK5JR_16015 [Tropicimonas sp.]|uniref:hypothetical protein n=1 Tax=Tropicimonas sp. TaxID=2067044 RepID=UPI003A88FB9E